MKRGQTRLDERCGPSYHLPAAGSCLPWREIRGCELAGYPGRAGGRRVALRLVSLTAVGQGLKIRPSRRESATEPRGACAGPGRWSASRSCFPYRFQQPRCRPRLDGVLAPDEQQGGGPGLRGRRLLPDLEDRRPLPGPPRCRDRGGHLPGPSRGRLPLGLRELGLRRLLPDRFGGRPGHRPLCKLPEPVPRQRTPSVRTLRTDADPRGFGPLVRLQHHRPRAGPASRPAHREAAAGNQRLRSPGSTTRT